MVDASDSSALRCTTNDVDLIEGGLIVRMERLNITMASAGEW